MRINRRSSVRPARSTLNIVRVIFEREVFSNRLAVGTARLRGHNEAQGVSFRDCRFESCNVGFVKRPARRLTVRDLVAVGSHVRDCRVGPILLEDAVLDGLETSDVLIVRGAAFRRVVLRGRVGRVLLSPVVDPWSVDQPGGPSREQRAFDEANHQHYRTVDDWVLDISEVEAVELDIDGIPVELIRRDSETQVIVSRDALGDDSWRNIDFAGTHFEVSRDFLLAGRSPARMLVVTALARLGV